DLAANVSGRDFLIRLALDFFDDFFGRRDLVRRGKHIHLDDVIAIAERDGLHAGGAAPHRTHIRLVEADRTAVVRADENLAVAVGQTNRVEVVALVDVDRDDAAGANVGERAQLRLLDL